MHAVGAVALAFAYLAFTGVGRGLCGAQIDAVADRLAEALVRGPLHSPVDRSAALGSPYGSLLLTFALALALGLRRGRSAGALVLVALAGITALEVGQRLRFGAVPWDDLPGLLARPRGRHLLVSTYPSGHAARATFLLLTAALSLPRRFAPVPVGIAVLLSLTVALQRVHAEAHSGSDVVGGLLLGGAAALSVLAVPMLGERLRSGRAPGEIPTGRAGAPPTGRRRSR